MPDNIYEIISLAARYWFALLGLVIVWRSFSWLRKDRRAKHKRLKHLPDAGMIGEMIVLEGSDELPEGTAIPVPRAGVLGFLRTCDVTVPVNGVAGKHIDFVFQDGKGLLLFPLRRQSCVMDGVELTCRSKTKKHPMYHGSRLQVGEAVLRLRLFAGLDTEYHPVYEERPQPLPFDDLQDVTADWQDGSYIYRQDPSPWRDQVDGGLPYDSWVPQEQPFYQEEPPQEDSWLAPAQPWQQPYDAPYNQACDEPYDQPAFNQQPYGQPAPFEPAQPRQRMSRAERRRYHEQ